MTDQPIRVSFTRRGRRPGWCWDCHIPHPHPISEHVGYGFGYESAAVAANVARHHLRRHHKDVIKIDN